jgi:hypothetical protein
MFHSRAHEDASDKESRMSSFAVVRNYFAPIVVRCLLLCVLASIALAQTADTGAIAGTVSDSAGGVIPQAEIAVINLGTGESRTATSAQNGSYSIPLLPPGAYRVDVSKTGFKMLSFSSVAVIVTETQTLNARLEVGAVSEHITVSSEAEQLQTASSALGRVTNEEMVTDLPLVTRNYTQIIGLNAGVATEVTNASSLGRGSGGESNFSAAGGTEKSNNYQMDGLAIGDLQNSVRRQRERHHQRRHQSVPRYIVRILPQRRSERE